MKKSKLSITLVTSFIAAMALSACGNVSSSKKAIVTFTPYGSNEKIELLTDDIYNANRTTSSGVSKLYDKILEVLIRYQFKEGKFGEHDDEKKVELKYKDIENWANNEVREQKKKAKDNAKSNSTKYETEWKSILDSNDVKNAEELKQKFIYQKEKEVMTNWYADNDKFAADLKDEFLGIKADGTAVESDVKAAMPYHVRHILIKVDEAGDAKEKFYKGTVTEGQAKSLYDTVSTLASGKFPFSQVAKDYSEDTSAAAGGDVGIMTNSAVSGSLAMVNEFQLGLYAYDNLYDAVNTDATKAAAATVIKAGLGITADVENTLKTNLGGLVTVPYEAFKKMGTYAKITADEKGNELAGGSAALYPRNVIWNKYFNLHNVFIIKNVESADYPATLGKEEFVNFASDTPCEPGLELPATNKSTTGFRNGILTDENGRVIVGVRSQFGIHLMVIEKSMYEYDTLATYYDTKLPTDKDYDPASYVGYVESPKLEDYKKRADDVKNKITTFDSTYDYRLYQYLLTKVKISFADEAAGLDKVMKSYIDKQKENNDYKQNDGLKKVWRTYTELLGAQDFNRTAEYTTINPKTGTVSPTLTRLVPEQVADDFYNLYKD